MTITRIGIIGAGAISTFHLDGIAKAGDRFRCTALVDPQPGAAAQRAAAYGVTGVFTELDAFIAAKVCDIAIVCTPTPIRRQVVEPLL